MTEQADQREDTWRPGGGMVSVPGIFMLLLALAISGGPVLADSIELDFDASAGTLSGTLFLPPGEGPYPAVIFLAGSGDESYRTGWEGERRSWFWPELQAWFAERGYAVYIFDKPGVGRSEGDWRKEDFGHRADNALAAVRMLGARSEIDKTRLGLLGHSQGGWIAVKAAARVPDDIAWVVSLAGPAIGVRQQIIEDTVNRWQCDEQSALGLRRAGLGTMLSVMGALGRVVPAGYLSRIVRYDPADDLARMRQPMLALFATHDIMVMPETNVPRLERYFGRDTGNTHLVVETIPGLDHFFRHGSFCLDTPRPQSFDPEFWAALGSSSFWDDALLASHYY
ncbi:alpha/beta fold hydrolase [Wenzhouxiangella sp. AB-CW3]|uniref:alpha/beta hydrolase family protein n=1 Tax=Wenzhouxiangella sp. AB-CW3 TaxID=2771012 RepID=UPI00168B6238|nr:alpha/beta fold hydrolase [Wenzhouxiangella sp. AB-CW3]QOC22395.1 alpha/beta fold hydrolase [Wenzhouxiangella sp. AB-CW3]